jgi:pantetheine-phosphate adenylyltransferase
LLRALYPGSFDPVTNGHINIAKRASELVDELTIAVYDAPPKTLLFSCEERVALFQEAVRHLPNASVEPFTGLLVNFTQSVNIPLVVKGIRAGSDFEDEFEQFLMNKKLAPEVEFIYLMSDLEWQFLSSGRVKEVAQLGGDVSDLVTPKVAKALQAKLQNAALMADR